MQSLGESVLSRQAIIPANARRVRVKIRGLAPEPTAVIAAKVHRQLPAGLVQQDLFVTVGIALGVQANSMFGPEGR